MAKSFLNQNHLPRGLRNNNPGNLIFTSASWQGKLPYAENKDWTGTTSNVVRKFEQFRELRYGLRALMRDIYNDYHSKKKTTVTALIKEYAPAFENNTQAYINTVIKIVGTNEITVLTEDILIKIAQAIVYVENGTGFKNYITNTDYKDAIAISGLVLKKKQQ